jgi:hypothetical protein
MGEAGFGRKDRQGRGAAHDQVRNKKFVERAVDSLDAKEQTAMHHALHQVLTTVAASGAHRRFGVCQDCTYLDGELRCNLTSASP